MIKGGRKTSKRGGKKMARRARLRRAVRRSTVPNYASATQTLQLPNDDFNTLYSLLNVNLSQFDRLSQIAACYQFYRIKLIEMKFKPFADTFTNGTTLTTGSLPYFYYLIDKDEVLIPVGGVVGFQQIRDAGAKPIRFDEKTVSVRWKPRVPQVVAGTDAAAPALNWGMASKVSPWLATNNNAAQDPIGWVASQIPHKGLYYGVDQDVSAGLPTQQYGTEITVHMEFKKPLTFTAGPREEPPVMATAKQIVKQ